MGWQRPHPVVAPSARQLYAISAKLGRGLMYPRRAHLTLHTSHKQGAHVVPCASDAAIAVRVANVAIIAGVITGSAGLVSLIGMTFAMRSWINIKPVRHSSLLYNADDAFIARKRAQRLYLSNDPSRQRDLECQPESMLFCRDVLCKLPGPNQSSTVDSYHRVNVYHFPVGICPRTPSFTTDQLRITGR